VRGSPASEVDPAVVIVGICCPVEMMYATPKLSLVGPSEVVRVMVTDPTDSTPVLEHVPSTCRATDDASVKRLVWCLLLVVNQV
jgi:hypothetical protein